MDSLDTTRIESLLSGTPYKRYIKATLSRVIVKILDPISLREVEIVLSGDPTNKPDSAILEVWTKPEDVYFTRNNKYILNEGLVIEYNAEAEQFNSVNAVSDDELKTALSGKFFNIKALLDKFTSPAPVERMLAMAEEMDKPTKTVQAIKGKLAELQMQEYENTGLFMPPNMNSENN